MDHSQEEGYGQQPSFFCTSHFYLSCQSDVVFYFWICFILVLVFLVVMTMFVNFLQSSIPNLFMNFSALSANWTTSG